MKLLFAGAALLALTLPALATDSPQPIDDSAKCIPYAEALNDIWRVGGHMVGDYAAPFVRDGRMLYYVRNGLVEATGVAHDGSCVYMPSAAVVGRLDIDPREL